MSKTIFENKNIEKDVERLLVEADTLITNTIAKVNYEIILMYFNLGKMITEYKKENNSKYGDFVIERFSKELSLKYGTGFNYSNITRMIKFYEIFTNSNQRTRTEQKLAPAQLFAKITWSHIVETLKIKECSKIKFYLNEVNNKNLTKLELRNSIKSLSYERTMTNQQKGIVKNKIEKTLKKPVILNIENKKRSERELEDEIIRNVSNFKKEIGNIVSFYERQYRLNINGLIHRIDLIFIDYETNTFILIDLKINKVTNHDILQMQLYIECFKKDLKYKANVIGVILCETEDLRLVENENIYQIRYLNEIPRKKELEKIINENKIILLKTEKLELENADYL